VQTLEEQNKDPKESSLMLKNSIKDSKDPRELEFTKEDNSANDINNFLKQ